MPTLLLGSGPAGTHSKGIKYALSLSAFYFNFLVFFMCLCSHWLLLFFFFFGILQYGGVLSEHQTVTKTWCVLVLYLCPQCIISQCLFHVNPTFDIPFKDQAFDHAPFTRKITHWTRTCHLDVTHLCFCV